MKVTLVLFTLCVVWFNEVSEVFSQSSVGPNVVCTDASACATYIGTYCGGYSQCKKCVCPSTGYVYDTTTTSCLTTALIDAACTANVQCPDKQGGTTAGGSCSSNKCACDAGYVATSDKKSCRKPYVGETCTSGVGCVDTTTIDCSSSNVCTCKANYPQVNSDKISCRQKYIDESCTGVSECLSTISGVTCPTTTNVCTCPDTTSGAAADKKSCNAQVLDGKCTVVADCNAPTIMTCTSNLCKCGTNNPQDGTTCRLPLYDETCTGTTCDSTADPNLNPTCDGTSNKCVCNTGYISTGGAKCAKLAIGATCAVADAACGTGATCTGTPLVCTCDQDFVAATNNIDCTAPVYDGTCTAGQSTCTGTLVNTLCPTGGKCECVQYRQADTASPGNCRLSKLTETCGTAAADCDQSITSVQCTGTPTVCSCPDTLNAVNGQCIKAKYGETCIVGSVTKTCETGTTCDTTTSKCACATGDTYDSTISACKNTGAIVAAADGDVCTVMPATPDWTSTNPVYKQCNTALTGVASLSCRECDNDNAFKCNTAISDPSASGAVHANIVMVLLAVTVAVFYKM